MTNGSSLSGLLTSICHCSFAICHLTENPCQIAKELRLSSTDKHGSLLRVFVVKAGPKPPRRREESRNVVFILCGLRRGAGISGSRQGSFCRFGQLRKGLGVFHSDFGQRLAIQSNAGLFQPAHELAVG